MKKILLLTIIFGITGFVLAQCPAPKAYTNPVVTGFFPDPSVVRVGDDYYIVNSTFEYFPAIVISHSKDLVNWKQIGHVFSKSDDLDLSYFFDGMGIWAPDISYHDGEFYIFYCLVQLSKDRTTNIRGNYMVKSKDILGPWSKPVQITDFGSDPSLFVDEDGENYMLFAAGIPTGNGTKIVKLNKECTKMVEEPHWLETEGKKAAPEGPHMLKKDGYYYFIMAASSGLFNGHHMLIARSKSVYGPFENSPNNPYLTQRDPNAVNFHQGHGKIINTQNGEWWTMVISQRQLQGMIRGRKSVVTQLGRETSLERISWDQNGWPVANGGKGPLDANLRPVLPWTPVFNASSDEFSEKQLGIQWMFRRNPVFENFSLTEKKGKLRIYSGDFDIDTILGRNLIVQRERWLKFTATTKMTFFPESREQAGITAHYDTKTYARLGLQKSEQGKLQLVLEERRYGKKSVLNVIQDIKKNTLYLRMKVDKMHREFFYSYDNKNWLDAGVIEDAAFLSDQGTPNWGFMGTTTGIYSFNRGTGKRIPADFDIFNIETEE
ncbi:MAG: glycoside hydrolase family 43 protein [Prolixibacteraceae bacterium]